MPQISVSIAYESKKEAETNFGTINWLKTPVIGFFDPSHNGRTNSAFQQLRQFCNREMPIIGFKPNGSPLSCELFIALPGEPGDEKTKIAQVHPCDFLGGRALLQQVGVPLE